MPLRDYWWCILVAKYGVFLFTESGAVVITDYISIAILFIQPSGNGFATLQAFLLIVFYAFHSCSTSTYLINLLKFSIFINAYSRL